jgi:hypothetical protein
LEADGLLVGKEELISRVWRGIVVSEENLKVQVAALRKALRADRDVIRTEFGRGYRFTGVLCTNTVTDARQRPTRSSGRGRWPKLSNGDVGTRRRSKARVPSSTGTPSASSCRWRSSTRKRPNSRAASAVPALGQFASCG